MGPSLCITSSKIHWLLPPKNILLPPFLLQLFSPTFKTYISADILFMIALKDVSNIRLFSTIFLSSFLLYPQLQLPQQNIAIMDDLTTVFLGGLYLKHLPPLSSYSWQKVLRECAKYKDDPLNPSPSWNRPICLLLRITQIILLNTLYHPKVLWVVVNT